MEISKHNNKIILVDMDSVLADFEKKFYDTFTQKFPDRRAISLQNRNTFYITDQYPEAYFEDIEAIYNAEGFFLHLEEIEGAIDKIRELETIAGVKIYICTTAPRQNPYAPTEKRRWIENHLGPNWLNRFILTHDKTLIRGDILIDDRPDIKGEAIPQWKHILYTQPYNQNLSGLSRMTWDNWKEVLLPLISA